MRLCNLASAQDNCVLAQSIRDSMGRVLLGAGVRLTRPYIERLMRLGYQTIFIEDDRLDDVEIVPAITDQTRDRAYKAIGRVLGNGTGQFNNSQISDLQRIIQRMIDDLLSCPNIPTILQSVRGFDEFTFHHSVNTTVIALILGVGQQYKEQQLTELGIGTLIHDIGKVRVPSEILNKLGPLTKEEFDLIKCHTNFGYDAARKFPDLSIISAHIAFQHHEKWDGSGYPRGLRQGAIHEYARIACVADVYEALTSPRAYRAAFQPYEAFEYVLAKSGSEFDPKLIDTFSKHIAVYPNGSGVQLSNGQRGNIVRQNPNFPSRPWVRVFYDKDKNTPLTTPLDVNLIDYPSLMIVTIDNY